MNVRTLPYYQIRVLNLFAGEDAAGIPQSSQCRIRDTVAIWLLQEYEAGQTCAYLSPPSSKLIEELDTAKRQASVLKAELDELHRRLVFLENDRR